MFLNERKVRSALASAKVQMIIGVIFIVFWGVGVVGGIVNAGEVRSYLPLYIFLMLPFIWLVWSSIRKKQQVEKARQLNQMFCSDADGILQSSQLAHTLGSKNEYQAIKTVGQLIGKGFLQNCTIEQTPNVHVVLYRNAPGGSVRITSVACPNCGANVEKREGFSVSCPYCGTMIP